MVMPARTSAAPVRYVKERDMVSLEEGDSDSTRSGGEAVHDRLY